MGQLSHHKDIIAVSYTPPQILVESTFSPPPVLIKCSPLHSTPHRVLMESTRSTYGVDCSWTLDLVKLKKSIGGVLVESLRTVWRHSTKCIHKRLNRTPEYLLRCSVLDPPKFGGH
jgi:hypothetical protein